MYHIRGGQALDKIGAALWWWPKKRKQQIALIVAMSVLAFALSYMYIHYHHTPTKRMAPAAAQMHQAQVTSVPVGIPTDAENHCHWVWFSVWFLDCHYVLQHDAVAIGAWDLNKAQNQAEVAAAIAAVCGVVGFFMANGAAVVICVAILSINAGHAKDVFDFANAADEDACVSLEYYQFFGVPGVSIVPASINGKAQDGGWCYDGFTSNDGCEYYLTFVNGWDVYGLVDEEPSTCMSFAGPRRA